MAFLGLFVYSWSSESECGKRKRGRVTVEESRCRLEVIEAIAAKVLDEVLSKTIFLDRRQGPFSFSSSGALDRLQAWYRKDGTGSVWTLELIGHFVGMV